MAVFFLSLSLSRSLARSLFLIHMAYFYEREQGHFIRTNPMSPFLVIIPKLIIRVLTGPAYPSAHRQLERDELPATELAPRGQEVPETTTISNVSVYVLDIYISKPTRTTPLENVGVTGTSCPFLVGLPDPTRIQSTFENQCKCRWWLRSWLMSMFPPHSLCSLNCLGCVLKR